MFKTYLLCAFSFSLPCCPPHHHITQFLSTQNLRMWTYLEMGSLQIQLKHLLKVKMNSYWIRVAPKSSNCCHKKAMWWQRHTQTHGEQDRGREWSDVSTSQGTQGIAINSQKLGEGHGTVSLRVSRKNQPWQHLDFGHLVSSRWQNAFCGFKPLSLW